jgi:tetratricopeptide (TPR) repeat protein
MDRAMTPENSVATNSTEDAKLNAALEALEAARELQKLRRSHGVDRIHLLVEDVDGDWLEEWGEDEVLDSGDFQDKLGFLAALARKEELKKEFRKREEEIDQEIQSFRVKIEEQIRRAYEDLPDARRIKIPGKEAHGKLSEPPTSLAKNIDKIDSLSPLIEFQPTGKDYFRLGDARFFAGLYEGAIADYDKALELEPDYAAYIYLNKGAAFHQLQDYEEAIKTYDKALESARNFPEAWYNRGSALSQRGLIEAAIAAYMEALKYKRNFPDAWISLGNLLVRLERYEEAIESYDEALKYKPDFSDAWVDRGDSLDNLDRYEEALESYDIALKYKPDFPEAWINRSNALNKLGCHKEAIASCKEALAYKPDHPQAWFNIACSQSRLGEIDQAIASLQKAIEINPKFREDAKTDSDFDAIRQDDRFQQLLTKDNQN